jgi:16S rRNA (adenine1518-N6/adenine1519-N6)-dimethyltransferase
MGGNSFGGSGARRAKRSLGQNFLQDPNTARRIVDALDIKPGEHVLEIGPGRGALCGHILGKNPGTFAALEKDAALASTLKARHPEIAVVYADALRFPWERLGAWPGAKIVGNLPYNIASPLMWEVLSRTPGLSRAVFMVQHEVAARIASGPGTKDYGALSVWLQSFAEPRLLFKVGPNAFHPRPRVDSAVVRFIPRPMEERPANPAALARLLKFCFQMRRKQIKKILKEVWSADLVELLEIHGFSPMTRPEAFPPEFFHLLAGALKSSFPS